MRKLAFYSVMMALCVADFAAFGASRTTAAGGRRTTQPAAQQTVSETPAQSSTTTARAAVTRKNVARAAAPVAAAPTNTAPQAARAAVSARAAAKQKVINMGTKVESATANTVVSEECQNAYYGCMDAFCMLDNASGGRCQCSDRNAELDLVLEEIMKLDEQSLAMATEGVERLQMGENAEEIMARAKAAADSVTGKGGNTSSGSVSGSKTVRKLDLSAWKNNSLFDDDDVDFDNTSLFSIAESSLADKTGDALQSEASKLCVAQMPDQCKSSTSFLQLTYAQKIKSDCSAYENSLKQQRSASAEKLQTAQKALRDTALEMYQNENKYDFGQCVAQFKNCMQTTGECGDDYSGCVADTAILGELYNGNKSGHSKPATTVIKTGATSITISSASYDILNTKKVMCQSVTKQCVNANKKDAVWQQVVKDLAPVIYTAEYNAASNNRMNCISTVVTCVQNVCASKWDDDTDNYDACLSDPNSIDNYCGLEYKRCGDDGSESSVRNYVSAKLAALKVDKCTKDVKECLLAEERCGADYSGCVGLNSSAVAELCPAEKLLSCQDREKGNEAGVASVTDYIEKIAQGIALNIDNKFATACQNAADAAMTRICGDTESCENVDFDLNTMLSLQEVKACLWKDATGAEQQCYPDASMFSDEQIWPFEFTIEWVKDSDNKNTKTVSRVLKNRRDNADGYGVFAKLDGRPDLSAIVYKNIGNETAPKYGFSKSALTNQAKVRGFSETNTQEVVSILNTTLDRIMDSINTDPTVDKCMNGREVEGFGKDKKLGSRENGKGRFSNLTTQYRAIVAAALLSKLTAKGISLENKFADKMLDMNKSITTQMGEAAKRLGKNVEDIIDAQNYEICKSDPYTVPDPNRENDDDQLAKDSVRQLVDKTGSYDTTTNVCTVKTIQYNCIQWKWRLFYSYCGKFNTGTVLDTQTVQLSKFQ